MSKLLKNTTNSIIAISDTGVSLPASPATYTIPPQDYLMWAASTNIITHINSGAVVVNDGVNDLSISRGLAYLSSTNATHLNGILLDQSLIADGRVPTYDSVSGTLKYVTPASSAGNAAGDKGWVQYRGNSVGTFAANSQLYWDEVKEALTVGTTPSNLNNLIMVGTKSANAYVQAQFQNKNGGTQASTDLVCTNDIGTDDIYYVDLGINSSGYSDPAYPLSPANASYLYNTGSHFTIGTYDRLTDLILHTGGYELTDERLRIKDAAASKDAQVILKAVMLLDRNTTANRPTTPINGMARYNTTTNAFEFYENGTWVGLGSTGANVGTGTGQVFRDKTAQTLNFKTLKEGVGTSIVNNANDITISSLGGSGSGGLFIANFSATANSNSNVFLNTFGVSASDGLPAVVPLTGTINKVTISLSGGVGTGTFEFRVNTTTGTPAFTATITGAQTASVSVSFAVSSNDRVNCKVASGASGISKPLVNIYM